MEQLARDVTAWGAHAVSSFFRILGDTQYMNDIRLWSHYTAAGRTALGARPLYRHGLCTAHRVHAARASPRGRYNIQNIGIFLWSLNAYSITQNRAVFGG